MVKRYFIVVEPTTNSKLVVVQADNAKNAVSQALSVKHLISPIAFLLMFLFSWRLKAEPVKRKDLVKVPVFFTERESSA